MSYRGTVKPGSPDVRDLPELRITKASVGPMDNNAYLLQCRRTDELVLVDAAAEPATLLGLLGGQPLARVITTHQHRDHWDALAEVVEATGAETVAGADDVDGIPEPTGRPVVDGDTISVGACTLSVIHLVGHTPGSIALLYDDPEGTPHLFTGDSLFPGGPGRTTHRKDFESLMGHLKAKVFGRLPDETWVYPGHGNDTTLGAERGSIPEWLARGW
ncbi:MAG: MBL fold metallo-hydrolase [Nocardioidaceae bacterium]|nr:MBL fold metallo-hydrolase [Nocardioidaceae bacterium]